MRERRKKGRKEKGRKEERDRETEKSGRKEGKKGGSEGERLQNQQSAKSVFNWIGVIYSAESGK